MNIKAMMPASFHHFMVWLPKTGLILPIALSGLLVLQRPIPVLAGDLPVGQPFPVKNKYGQVQLERQSRKPSRLKAVQVVDGTTLQLTSGELARLIGVSAPPPPHPPEGQEPFGPEAAQCLKGIIGGQRVRMEAGIEPRDSEGRLLAHVYTERGIYVNAELLRRGCAKLFIHGPNTGQLLKLVAAQEEARKARRGVWGQPALLP